MNYILLLAFALLPCLSAVSQPDEGAMRTGTGLLLYLNAGPDSHTFHLEGEVDLSSFPLIQANGHRFQFHRAPAADFGDDAEAALMNYMFYEVDFLKQSVSDSIRPQSSLYTSNGILMNFWKYDNPATALPPEAATPVKMTCFLDFVRNGLLYRLVYASASGDDAEAVGILMDLFNRFRFYESGIDLEKLQQAVVSGGDHY